MEAAINDAADKPDDDSRDLPDFPDPRAGRIVQLCLEGCTYEQIAATLRCDIKTVYNLRREYDLDPLVEHLAIEAGHATIRAYIAMRRKAFMKAAQLLEHEDPGVALGAIKEALQYVAKREPGPGDKQPQDGPQRERSRDELVRRAREAAAKRLK